MCCVAKTTPAVPAVPTKVTEAPCGDERGQSSGDRSGRPAITGWSPSRTVPSGTSLNRDGSALLLDAMASIVVGEERGLAEPTFHTYPAE